MHCLDIPVPHQAVRFTLTGKFLPHVRVLIFDGHNLCVELQGDQLQDVLNLSNYIFAAAPVDVEQEFFCGAVSVPQNLKVVQGASTVQQLAFQLPFSDLENVEVSACIVCSRRECLFHLRDVGTADVQFKLGDGDQSASLSWVLGMAGPGHIPAIGERLSSPLLVSTGAFGANRTCRPYLFLLREIQGVAPLIQLVDRVVNSDL